MYNPNYHNRQSTRYPGYDYSSIGWYFVTINTKNQQCIFGEIHNSQMQLNELGMIVYDEWMNTLAIRDNIILHEFIVMPNHIHGIIEIQHSKGNRNVVGKFRSPSETLGAIVRGFKGAATKRVKSFCIQLDGKHSPCILSTTCSRSRTRMGVLQYAHTGTGTGVVKGTIWQRNFHDRIIRDQKELYNVKNYILNNPKNWSK